jgi:hypothetical protein
MSHQLDEALASLCCPLPTSAVDAVRDKIAAGATPESLAELIGQLEGLQEHARLHLRGPQAPTTPAAPAHTEGNVSVKEAARRLGISPAFIYKNKTRLPFVAMIGRRVVCCARSVERWNVARMRR